MCIQVQKPLSREIGELKYVSCKDIEKNPYNPRMIFDPDSMTILENSIKKVGILIPLLVYRRKKDDKYVLLDGERRLRSAIHLDLDKVPVNVIPEPDTLENI